MRIRFSYRTKLMSGISFVSIGIVFIFAAYRIFYSSQELTQRAYAHYQSIGTLLANNIVNDLLDNDFAHLKGIVIVAPQQAPIEFISIIDGQNRVRYSSQKDLLEKSNPYLDSPGLGLFQKTHFIRSFPLRFQSYSFGKVQIAFSVAELNKEISSTVWEGIVEGLTGLLAILAVAWLISGRLIQPLWEMKAASERIAKGDFTTRVKVDSKDVLGALGESLNRMAGQLNALTSNLREKIAEETAKLTQANQDLSQKTVELEKINQRLSEMDKLKSEFVSITSHELRTPLTSIIGFAQTLQKLDLEREQRDKYLGIIESEGKRLAVLIDDFLDISRIESGNIELRISPFSVGDLARETVEGLALPQEIKIRMEIALEKMEMEGDRDRIKQVLVNLLSNAIRYTPSGEIITLRAEARENTVRVSVMDQGPGISPENQKLLFTKFFRCGDPISKTTRGSGLGLAIAKGIVELHGGTLTVFSEPGKGSVFAFTIPLKRRNDA